MNKFLKNIIWKLGIMILIFAWIFWRLPQIFSRAQEATSTPAEIATTTSEMATQSSTSTPPEPIVKEPASKSTGLSEEILNEEENTPQPEPPSLSSLPPLKERKLEKQIILDKNARHECQAKSFTIDISGRSSPVIFELELSGGRDDSENLEIGSLPLGIDITFLNNADYNWRPAKSDRAAILQVVNQSGSQNGNFSIPIVYQSGGSTMICQINIINF